MKIQSTQDYNLFQRIAGNRVLSKPHINRLKAAMEEDPETVTYNPIIVNERYEVIDGQHRLEAMEALGLPVYYLKVDNLGLETVQKLNSVAKQWTPIDYAKSFRELGNENYKLYLEFKREFGFNHDILMKFMAGQWHSNRLFKEGKFVVKDIDEAYRLCSYLRDIIVYYDRAKLRNQAYGYLTIAVSEAYDHKHMLHKLRQHADKIIEQKTAVDYAREFERIYNYHSHGDAIRLF